MYYKPTILALIMFKYWLLICLIANPALASAAESITFDDPNDTISAIKQLPKTFSGNTSAAWVKLVNGEPRYLFIMPIEKCGASDCTIIGYQKTSKGWVKVYEVFGGDGLKILDAKTQNHNNIEQYESRGAGDYIIKTSKWNNNKYAPPTITKPLWR